MPFSPKVLACLGACMVTVASQHRRGISREPRSSSQTSLQDCTKTSNCHRVQINDVLLTDPDALGHRIGAALHPVRLNVQCPTSILYLFLMCRSKMRC